MQVESDDESQIREAEINFGNVYRKGSRPTQTHKGGNIKGTVPSVSTASLSPKEARRHVVPFRILGFRLPRNCPEKVKRLCINVLRIALCSHKL